MKEIMLSLKMKKEGNTSWKKNEKLLLKLKIDSWQENRKIASKIKLLSRNVKEIIQLCCWFLLKIIISPILRHFNFPQDISMVVKLNRIATVKYLLAR